MVNHDFLDDVDEYLDSLGDDWGDGEDSDVEMQCYRFAMERKLHDASQPVNTLRLELERLKEPGKEHPYKIGDYYVMGKFGEGISSVVYECYDDELQQHRALKIGKPAVLDDVDFSRESRFLSGLNHPNISRFFSTGKHDGRPYFVSEAIHGTTLLHADLNSVEEKVSVVTQVLDGLIHAVSQDIFHGDLKPNNILIDDSGTPKIVDWGGADWISDNYSDKRLDTFTRRYAAPEREELPCAKSDQYSVGVMLFEMLTKKIPKDLERAEQILVENEIAPEVREACLKAIQPDESKRFETHEQFKQALTESLFESEVTLKRTSKLRSLALATIAVALCCIPFVMPYQKGFDAELISPALPVGMVPEQEIVKVLATARVPGAEFRMIAADKSQVFKPDSEGLFSVPPAEYFVTAKWSDDDFVTTCRKVPKPQDIPQAHSRIFFERLPGGVVRLSPLNRPEREVSEPPIVMPDGSKWLSKELAVGLPFSFGVTQLELLGYRPPTLEERQAISIPNDDLSIEEWTTTITSYRTIELTHKYELGNHRAFSNADEKTYLELSRRPDLGMRGVRDPTPLGF